MADRSAGSLAQTRFSSELSATSGAGSGVRAEVSVDPDRSVELPQAASPRQEPQSRAASAAADALMGELERDPSSRAGGSRSGSDVVSDSVMADPSRLRAWFRAVRVGRPRRRAVGADREAARSSARAGMPHRR